MSVIPFISREEFNALKSSGELKPCALFPVLDYDICKYVWDKSPLIQHLLEALPEPMKK